MKDYRYTEPINQAEDYECMNMSYRIIEDLDYQNAEHRSSFYRSDFRGTLFASSIFDKNNFDLADFINNTFKNIEFCEVNFGNSEFKNCYFHNCVFDKNCYDDISIHSCTFSNCTFRDERFLMTMIDCQFSQCTFINCVFDQCTTDSLSFDNTLFFKCELSAMHAENFKFINCSFRDVFLGACYLGTYMFKDSDINLISFKYRGKVVDINTGYFYNNLQKELLQEHRYFEYFNLCILSAQIEQIVCPSNFKNMIESIFKEPNNNVRNYNLSGIFDVIEFYLGSNYLTLMDALQCLNILSEYPAEILPAENKLTYLQHIYHLESVISSFKYSSEYILKIPQNIPCTTTIHIIDDSINSAERVIHSIMDYVNKKYLGNIYEKPYFTVLSHEQGSIIVTISSSLLLILMTAKVIEGVCKSMCNIQLQKAKTEKEIELINTSSTPTALTKITSVLQPNEKEDKDVAVKLFSKLGNGYIVDFIVHYFLK